MPRNPYKLKGHTYIGTDHHDEIYGRKHDDLIRGGGASDDLFGKRGDDRLFGEEGDDSLIGGPGSDYLDGGAGDLDFADYRTSPDGVVVNLSASTVFYDGITVGPDRALDGYWSEDVLVGIEGARGSAFDDWLIGSDGENMLEGYDGNDQIDAGGGFDLIRAGDGDDQVHGGAGNDILLGEAGADRLDGGDGDLDQVAYGGSDSGVIVNLSDVAYATDDRVVEAGTAWDGGATDTLISIERVSGSLHDDILIGSNGRERFSDSFGSDILIGNGGGDLFFMAGGGVDENGEPIAGDGSSDRIVYDDVFDSRPGGPSVADEIRGFSQEDGDLIDLSALDADPNTDGDQAFTFIGNTSFTGDAGQLRTVNVGSDVFLALDLDGDTENDMEITVRGVGSMSEADFIL